LEGDDRILCQITSQQVRDRYAVELGEHHFQSGSLKQSSNARPNRLFTADVRIILYQAGHVRASKVEEIIDRVVEILRR